MKLNIEGLEDTDFLGFSPNKPKVRFSLKN